MKIIISSDHAGFELKNGIKNFLEEAGYEVRDMGPFEYRSDDDYPELILPVAIEIAKNPALRGIIIGGSGQGEAMSANRIKGVRATVFYGGNTDILKISRQHNDANVLSLGARFMNFDEAKEAVALWLGTPFSGEERHKRRIFELDNF